MPTDEQGDKWACEPCIRGHRSTRCEHWDRFMLRVKKPGRPLSSCPHPKGNCPCGKEKVMMVRIPKASSCICAPVYSVGADGSSPTPHQPSPLNAQSGLINPLTYTGIPLVGTNGSLTPVQYRVQKVKRRSASIVDPQAVARAFDTNGRYAMTLDSPTTNGPRDSPSVYNSIGSSTANIPAGANLELIQSMPQIWQSRPNDPGILPATGISHSEALLHDWDAYYADPLIPPTGQYDFNKDVQGTAEPPRSLSENARRSCCQPVRDTQDDTVIEQAGIITRDRTPDQERKGICLQKEHVLPHSASYDHAAGSSATAGNQTDAQVPMSEIGSCSLYSSPSSNSVVNHLSNSKQAPRHQQKSPGNVQLRPQFVYPSSGVTTFPIGESLTQSPAHNCNCGDDCDCLGCAAHPYNATTRHHVEDLSRILADGYDIRPMHSPETIPDKDDTTANTCNASHQFSPISSRVRSPTLNDTSDTTSLPNHDEHISTASPFTEQIQSLDNMFSSRDFYTMEFLLDSAEAPYHGCSDMSGTCMCGNDCSCIGCLTHSGHSGDAQLEESSNSENTHQWRAE